MVADHRLSAEPVEVWWAREPDLRPAHEALLAPAERDRCARLPAASRVRSTLAAAVLRLAAARRLGVGAADVPVVRRCGTCDAPHGRPTLPGTGLHASVSHTRGRICVALAAHPVGVDVEAERPLDVPAIARLVTARPVRTAAELLVEWTRRESAVKATGEGLVRALRDVVVSAPGEAPRLLAYPGLTGCPGAMADLAPGPGWFAAVTVLGVGTVAAREAPFFGRPRSD